MYRIILPRFQTVEITKRIKLKTNYILLLSFSVSSGIEAIERTHCKNEIQIL